MAKYISKNTNAGAPKSDLKATGKTDKTGTEITFYPDETIFETTA